MYMSGGRAYSAEKLQELIVYIADASEGDRRFGMTKFNKILFFSDFEAYRRTGSSITGAEYMHLDQGPVPHQMLPSTQTLQASGAIAERREETYGGTQRRWVALRQANLDLFSAPEIAIVNEILTELAPLTNKQAANLSHETMAWRLTESDQEVPYGTALLSSDTPSDEDLRWLEAVGASLVSGAQ
jgi:hypothetical protein